MEMIKDYLPISRADMEKRGWEQCDFVYVTGDAYVDHPSFGHAIISRVLESRGYKVGIIPQPDWKDPKSIQVLGEPRLGFLVTAGNMDSMVNHYSVSKKRRSKDLYTPGGEMGHRIQQSDPLRIQKEADHPWRDRGKPPPPGSLRLLVRESKAIPAFRLPGGPDLLRHGGTVHHRDRGRFRQRPGCGGYHIYRRNRIPDKAHRAGLRLPDPSGLPEDPGR